MAKPPDLQVYLDGHAVTLLDMKHYVDCDYGINPFGRQRGCWCGVVLRIPDQFWLSHELGDVHTLTVVRGDHTNEIRVKSHEYDICRQETVLEGYYEFPNPVIKRFLATFGAKGLCVIQRDAS